MNLHHGDTGSCFETTCSSIGPSGWEVEQCEEYNVHHEGARASGWMEKKQPIHSNRGYFAARDFKGPAVRLRVAHLEPISIRPKNKNPQIVNVCQTFRFPDNFITQNNSNRLGQLQEQHIYQQRHGTEPGSENRDQLLHSNAQHTINPCRSRLGGFLGANRHRQRSMHSQTSRTLLELVEAEQSLQQQEKQRPIALPRSLNQATLPPRVVQDVPLVSSESDSTISNSRLDRRVQPKQNPQVCEHPREDNVRPQQLSYFTRTKDVDDGAHMDGHYKRSRKHPLMIGNGKQPKRVAMKGKVDHRRLLYEDSQESPFVGDPLVSISGRALKQRLAKNQSVDDEDEFLGGSGNSDDDLDDQDLESDGCMGLDEQQLDVQDEESELEAIEQTCVQRRDNRGGGRASGIRDGSTGISGIVDKLQDNVWEVCLEGIWDLMDIAGRIDWKAQEKYITVINRKLIEFLKSPRTALCRSACQVTGELFREAKSTKRPEFDEIVDLLLCKTADPNRFIQKDANLALDKLVSCIATPHTVRALSIRGTIHRNPLVRTATARLLVCICVVAGLDAILGTAANTRTRKTILSMLVKILTDKNQETRRFGERLYRMLRKHKFFDEYFYKDMDNNLRMNLKRVLKGI